MELTGKYFCSLPCLLQLCNGRTSPSLGTGCRHTHLCSYKAGKVNPLPPTMPRVASERGGSLSLCQDVRRCHPPRFSGWDGVKFALCTSVCVSSTVPYFLLRDRLNINTATYLGGGKGRGKPYLTTSRGQCQRGRLSRGLAAERRQSPRSFPAAVPGQPVRHLREVSLGRGGEGWPGAPRFERRRPPPVSPGVEGASGARRQRESSWRHPLGAQGSDPGNPAGDITCFPFSWWLKDN